MGRGHGGTGGSTWRGGGDASTRGMSTAAAKAVSSREEEIRNTDNYERGSIFDSQGREVGRNDRGANGSVRLPGEWENNIITHNHPLYGRSHGRAREDEGGSLSRTDIMNTVRLNAAEMRAVTRHYTYSLRRPEQGWGVDHKDNGYVATRSGRWVDNADMKRVSRAYLRAKKNAMYRREQYIRNYKGDKAVARRRSFAVLYHQINREFAKSMGYEYSKTKVK